MASYSYGPPPPAPPLAGQPGHGPGPGPSGYPQYPQPFHQPAPHAAHATRGGRGGHHAANRGGYSGSPPYGYNNGQPSQFAQQGVYPASHPPQTGYPPQQWQHDQAPAYSAHPPASQAQPSSLPPQNYHPNYAPQIYQQQTYGQQPAYQQPVQQQPPYGHQYGPPSQPSGPPAQQWQGPPPPPQFGNGRGRGGHHSGERGGPRPQMMGPPIRIGFDGGGSQDYAAPVSNSYHSQAYGPPHGGASPYPGSGPSQGYPAVGPSHAAGPAHFDPYLSHGGRPHGRGGYQGNAARGRPFGGDKTRYKKSGGSLPTPISHHQKPDAASVGKKKKRKTNTLGLTPGDESDEDDADEEARLLELVGPDAPNPTDIAAWIVERRQNFPTQARTKAKMAELATKIKPEGVKDSTSLAIEKQQQKAEKLRKQLEKVESSIKRKREQQDEGDDMRDVGASPSVSSESKSDDEGPEALPSRPEATASNSLLPPPPRKADPSKHCKYYSTGGTCGKKGKCRFVHDPAVREAALKEREMNGGRITLNQRLILNDKDQEDLTIIKTLQYLKEKGMIENSTEASHPRQLEANAKTSLSSGAAKSYFPPPPIKMEPHHSLPPQPPPSVVPAPQTVRYQGWNLSGFGNTGVKSGDI